MHFQASRALNAVALAAQLQGRSLRQLARDLDVSPGHLSRALRGERTLDGDLAIRLLRALAAPASETER